MSNDVHIVHSAKYTITLIRTRTRTSFRPQYLINNEFV